MSNVGGQDAYYYETQPPLGGRPPSSRLWPALIGAGMVVAVVLVLLVALQLTDGDDESATSSSAAPTSTAAPSTTSAAVVTDTTATPTASTAAPSTPATTAAPAAPTTEEQGEDEPVGCDTYSVNESLPVQLCDRGSLVEEIQSALSEAGINVEVDGLFGPKTKSAVVEFQSQNDLAADGIVGEDTFDKLP